MLAKIDPNRLQRLEIKLLHIHRRRLQNQLKLGVLEEPVRILAIPPIRRPPRRLRIAHPVRLGPQHAQKRLRSHRARAHFHVIRLLQHAPALRPEALQAKQQFLKRQR